MQIGELAVADPNLVARMERLRPAQRLLVEIRAVRRSQVFDHDHVTLARDAGVPGGGKRIVEPDLDIAPAESSAVIWYFVSDARLVSGGVLDQQARLEVIEFLERRGRVHAGRIRGGGLSPHGPAAAPPQVAH